jgi:hypothetical protein
MNSCVFLASEIVCGAIQAAVKIIPGANKVS